MNKDCGLPLTKLNVDGKMTSNDLLMQLQADLIGIPVRKYAWGIRPSGHSAFLSLIIFFTGFTFLSISFHWNIIISLNGHAIFLCFYQLPSIFVNGLKCAEPSCRHNKVCLKTIIITTYYNTKTSTTVCLFAINLKSTRRIIKRGFTNR